MVLHILFPAIEIPFLLRELSCSLIPRNQCSPLRHLDLICLEAQSSLPGPSYCQQKQLRCWGKHSYVLPSPTICPPKPYPMRNSTVPKYCYSSLIVAIEGTKAFFGAEFWCLYIFILLYPVMERSLHETNDQDAEEIRAIHSHRISVTWGR